MIEENEKLLGAYVENIRLYRRSDQTITTVRSSLKDFLGWLDTENKKLTEVSQDDIEEWMGKKLKSSKRKKELKASTLAFYIQRIKSLYDFLVSKEYVAKNPAKDVLTKINATKLNFTPRPYLSVEDVTKIVRAAMNPRDRAMIILFYKTGMRVSELAQLNVDNIDWDDRRITIPRRKKGSPGEVYFDEECKRHLQYYIAIRVSKEPALFVNWKGARLTKREIDMVVKKVAIKSGVGKDTNDIGEAITPHVFRYAFTTHLQQRRCHPHVIQMLRGDRNKTMLDYYTRMPPMEIRKEYLRCIPKLGV